MTIGLRNALKELTSWLVAAAMIVCSVIYFEELKLVTAQVIGLKPPGATIASTPDRRWATPPTSALAETISRDSVALPVAQNGHYYTRAVVNGRPIDVMVDTGATLVALTYEDAREAGVYLSRSDFTHQSRTANGLSRNALVTLDRLQIGGIEVRNVKASVSEPGSLHVTLLGMSFLGKLSRVEMRDGRLILQN